MKLATGIIGMFLGLLILLQSCGVAAGGGLIKDHATSGAGAIGMLVGVLFFIGGAFAFGLPLVATIVFSTASLLAFLGSQGLYADLKIWSVVSLVLAAMAFFPWRSARRAKAIAA